jgi:hypothetical protein
MLNAAVSEKGLTENARKPHPNPCISFAFYAQLTLPFLRKKWDLHPVFFQTDG